MGTYYVLTLSNWPFQMHKQYFFLSFVVALCVSTVLGAGSALVFIIYVRVCVLRWNNKDKNESIWVDTESYGN